MCFIIKIICENSKDFEVDAQKKNIYSVNFIKISWSPPLIFKKMVYYIIFGDGLFLVRPRMG